MLLLNIYILYFLLSFNQLFVHFYNNFSYAIGQTEKTSGFENEITIFFGMIFVGIFYTFLPN